jgi:hypothetical protein
VTHALNERIVANHQRRLMLGQHTRQMLPADGELGFDMVTLAAQHL